MERKECKPSLKEIEERAEQRLLKYNNERELNKEYGTKRRKVMEKDR